MVKIGHASLDENKKISGGLSGDQTGKEVFIQDWYLRPDGWTTVFRAKNFVDAEKIAKAMEQACANENIGYDQQQRTTLYAKAKAVGWDISKITEKCECDCSSLVAVCVNAAGIYVSKSMYTGNQKQILMNTNQFEIFADTRYTDSSNLLRRGDILLGNGHTAIILSDGLDAVAAPVEIKASTSAQHFSKASVGEYVVTANKLNVRHGAGTLKKIIVTIPKDTKVKCFGYYTKALSTNWLYVQFTYNNICYTGFCSAKYLRRV